MDEAQTQVPDDEVCWNARLTPFDGACIFFCVTSSSLVAPHQVINVVFSIILAYPPPGGAVNFFYVKPLARSDHAIL